MICALRQLALLAAFALSLPAQQPAFDVATIKPSTPDERVIGMFVYPGGRLTVTNYPLTALIHEAYGVQENQIEGGPKWARETRFSINALPPSDSASAKLNPTNPKLPPSDEEKQMLRTLLADRFHLVLREESREVNARALIADGKLGLQPVKDPNAFAVIAYPRPATPDSPTIAEGINATMKMLAERLTRDTGSLIVDQTGLTGAYDFRFEYAVRETSSGPSLSSAIRDLGLKLVAIKALESRLVIERAELPGEN